MQEYSISPLMQFMNQGIQPSSFENVQNQDMQKEFQQILSAMMFGQLFSPLSEGGNTQSMMGSDILSPLMFMLMNNFSTDSATTDLFSMPSNQMSLAQAQMIHINQFDAEKLVGGDGANANCGPTALTMALHGIGLPVAGETSSSSNGQIIDLARRSMIRDSYRDGVDANGNRAEYEHNSYTNFTDLKNGVLAAGARGELIEPNAEMIRSALLQNGKVVVSGTFAGKSPLPWTGDRGHDNQSAPGGATAHFVTVTGYDSQRDLFIVNDPARRTPLVVTGATLENFMRGNAGALSVHR
jgi:hypothetical protein